MSPSKNRNPKDTELPILPPNDIVAEQSVIGAMMLGGSQAVAQAAALLDPAHFYRDSHADIYRAMLGLYRRGEPLDVVTLQAELKASGNLESAGGLSYLLGLGETVPTTANLTTYIATVRDMAARRRLIGAAATLCGMAQALEVPLADVIAATENETAIAARLASGAKCKPLATVCLADVEAESVLWLWQGRVPYGALTVLDGDPGKGKTTLALDLAARVTNGLPMPGSAEPTEPGNVLLLCAEDSAATTLKPRLDAAGANMRRVFIEEPETEVYLPDSADAIAAAVRFHEARLVVIDPLMAFLPAEVNANRDQDVRRALRPLVAVAQETGAAFLILRHLNKGSQGSNALYRGGGSIGITGAARSVIMVTEHPEEPEQRVLCGVKMNLCRMPPSLAFALESDQPDAAPRIRWYGEYEKSANELLAASAAATQPQRAERATATTDAADFLRELLAFAPMRANLARDAARAQNISDRTLDRAKPLADVHAFRLRDGDTYVWYWQLGKRKNANAGEERQHEKDGENGFSEEVRQERQERHAKKEGRQELQELHYVTDSEPRSSCPDTGDAELAALGAETDAELAALGAETDAELANYFTEGTHHE